MYSEHNGTVHGKISSSDHAVAKLEYDFDYIIIGSGFGGSVSA